MNQRTAAKYDDLGRLRDAGWELKTNHNHIAPNSGSETIQHLVLKAVAGKVLLDAGFRVASEVEHEQRGEIDVLGYGNPDREMICIEVETDPSPDVIADKLDRYVHGTPIIEMFVIDVFKVTLDVDDAKAFIEEETGL